MGFFQRMFGAWSGLSAFNRLSLDERRIVFYAEGQADWPHLGPIAEELAAAGHSLCYVTSDPADPVLALGNPRIVPFFVGAGSARTVFFKGLEAKVLVMTLPDLETFQLKRSVHPVHYAYVFHSMVSSHMIYRKGAFDAYDTVFCVGPHHVAEIRRTEQVYGLRAKELVEHGYARLDKILRTAASRTSAPMPAGDGPGRNVLLAPSWGECSFIEHPCGVELIRIVLAAGHRVILRLHPMTVRRFPALVGSLEKRFEGSGASFKVVTDMNEQESLHRSEIMVGDWSGAAFDYGFGLERPVLFVDTPKKVNNPEWEKLGLPALEASVREELGAVIAVDGLEEAPGRIEALCADPAAFRDRLRAARARWIFNVGKSAEVGARHVARLAFGGQPDVQAEAK